MGEHHAAAEHCVYGVFCIQPVIFLASSEPSGVLAAEDIVRHETQSAPCSLVSGVSHQSGIWLYEEKPILNICACEEEVLA